MDKRLYSEEYRNTVNEALAGRGVIILDPRSAFIDPGVVIGEGTVIYPSCVIEGETVIGKNCHIGLNTRLKDMRLADGVSVESSVCLESEIGAGTKVGPFAYIRPNSRIGENVKIGDFVEVKNSVVGDGSKAPHLSYIGDADLGRGVNFGCGSITSNFDGAYKRRTVINDGAFIGCNTNLVAPVTVGENAYTAAGSTVTEDVPDNALAVARARQVNKTGWKRPEKN